MHTQHRRTHAACGADSCGICSAAGVRQIIGDALPGSSIALLRASLFTNEGFCFLDYSNVVGERIGWQ